MFHEMVQRIRWILFHDQIIHERILAHQLSLLGKYDTPEFEKLPHMEKFNAIISDSIIPGLYEIPK